MNKKEIAEIKKLFNKTCCHVTKICGCYVDAEKNIKTTIDQHFQMLDEEEMFKYINIFRGCLSGSIGKNLINLEFPRETESEGGTQEFLLRLRDSRLREEDLINEFYDKVIEHYNYPENYYIVLAHAAYDIPGITSDEMGLDDASVYVYEHLICAICPVKLDKSGLCYNSEANTIETKIREWLVDRPVHGFLFPAFNDRNTDIHAMLYYTRKSDDMNPSFMDNMFGCVRPLTSKNQNATFRTIIERSLGDECSFEAVKSIHESINELIEEQKDEPEPVVLDKNDVKNLIGNAGVSGDKLESFDSSFERIVQTEADNTSVESDDVRFVANNITNHKNLEIKTDDVVIKVNNEQAHHVETRIIDGVPYLMIQINGNVVLNGVVVHPDDPKLTAE